MQQDQQQGQQQIPPVMDLVLTVDEAQMILNKLNEANFKGFAEAGMAMTVFSKIKSAKPRPMQAVPPFSQIKETKEPSPMTSSFKEPEVPKKEVKSKLDTEPKTQDEQPKSSSTFGGAPLMPVEKKSEPFTEDKETGDLVFTGEEDIDPTTNTPSNESVSHKSAEGTTIVEGGNLTDNDNVPPIEAGDEPAFSVVENTSNTSDEENNDSPPQDNKVADYI